MPNDFASGSAPAAATPLFSGATLLDAEKLDCYRLAMEFQALAPRLLPSAVAPLCAISSTAPVPRSL